MTSPTAGSGALAFHDVAMVCGIGAGGRLTEEVWNTTATLDYLPYAFSKAAAEREAWQIAEAQKNWDMVAINPCLVMGPAIGGRPTSESFRIMRRAGNGTFRWGAPRIGIGIADVHDVAQAHIAAGFLPAANGRNIVCGHQTDMLTAMQTLEPEYGDTYPIPDPPFAEVAVVASGALRGARTGLFDPRH